MQVILTMNAIILQFCVGVLSMSIWWNTEVFAANTPPNIVFILADDFGYRDVGYHGSTAIRTPTLDRLADGGVRLDNYYVQPLCTPSRSQLLSGRYDIHTGLQHGMIAPCQANSLPKETPTLADELRDAGYATHMVGKWHLGHYAEQLIPTRRGFDSFFGFLNGGELYSSHILCVRAENVLSDTCELKKKKDYIAYRPTASEHDDMLCGLDLRSNEAVSANYSGQYSTHLFTEKAIDVIAAHASKEDAKPLFLYLAYQAVHYPLEVPEAYTAQYESIADKNRRLYAGMTTCMDEGVLNITSALEKYGLWDNTILIFSSDNGGKSEYGGNNWPLRGGKSSLWEGGMRGVGFVHSPLIKHSGTINSGLIHISDWFPTILSLAGRDTTGLNVDGFDVWRSISDAEPSPRKELLHNIDPLTPKHGSRLNISKFDNRVQAAIRVGNWKLITGNPDPVTPAPMKNSWIAPPEDADIHSVRNPDPVSKNVWLFDISSDPYEKTDLFESHRDIAVDMLNRLAEYQSTAVPPRFPKMDRRCNPKDKDGIWGPWRKLKRDNKKTKKSTRSHQQLR